MKLSKMPRPDAFYICRTIDGKLRAFDKRCNSFRIEDGLVIFSHDTIKLEPPMTFDMAGIPLEQILIIERKEKGEQMHVEH